MRMDGLDTTGVNRGFPSENPSLGVSETNLAQIPKSSFQSFDPPRLYTLSIRLYETRSDITHTVRVSYSRILRREASFAGFRHQQPYESLIV
jgi:hypothetical protein